MLGRVTRVCPPPEPPQTDRGRLQADRRRAAARRLPGRDAEPPRGRGLPRLGGDRLGHRPADRAPRRAVRRRRAAGLDRRRPSRSTSWRWSSRTTRGCGGWRSSTPPSTTPIARAAIVLPVAGGAHIHGVDHGVCFSTYPKLRTVLWGWRGPAVRGRRARRAAAHRGRAARRPRPAAGAAPVAGRDRGHAAAGRRAARPRPIPLPARRLAGDPLAAVLTPSRFRSVRLADQRHPRSIRPTLVRILVRSRRTIRRWSRNRRSRGPVPRLVRLADRERSVR